LDNKFGLLDSCLSFILKPKYENIVVLENKGFLVLEKESEITNKTENFTYKTTFFDKKMNIIKIFGDSIKNIECLYTSHTTIRDSKLIMLFQFYNGKKWGIMNTSGEIILPAKFDSFEYSEQKIVGRERYSYTKFFTLDGKEIE
jgi:hypothetical protein